MAAAAVESRSEAEPLRDCFRTLGRGRGFSFRFVVFFVLTRNYFEKDKIPAAGGGGVGQHSREKVLLSGTRQGIPELSLLSPIRH